MSILHTITRSGLEAMTEVDELPERGGRARETRHSQATQQPVLATSRVRTNVRGWPIVVKRDPGRADSARCVACS
jgi:hypothetical protein